MESCGIVTQREQALVVLVHIKLSVLDARNRRAGDGDRRRRRRRRQYSESEFYLLILALGGGRRWVPVGLVCRLDVAELAADLVEPGEWPVLPLVLLHPVLGSSGR